MVVGAGAEVVVVGGGAELVVGSSAARSTGGDSGEAQAETVSPNTAAMVGNDNRRRNTPTGYESDEPMPTRE